MLPSLKWRREQIVFAVAAGVFFLAPFPVAASLIPIGFTPGDAGPERDLPFGLLALEQTSVFGEEEQAPSDRATGNVPPVGFAQLFYVERRASSSTAGASTTELSGSRRGETLRQVLRSITTTHSLQYAVPKGLQKERPAPDEVNDNSEWQGLAALLLDSEAIGAVARSFVEIKSADSGATVFSILGLGEFVLDVSPSVHAAALTELSSGVSVGTPLGAGYSVYANYGFNGVENRGPRERVNVLHMIWDWVLDAIFSPVGLLASMVAGIALLLWLFMKSVNLLQGRRVSR